MPSRRRCSFEPRPCLSWLSPGRLPRRGFWLQSFGFSEGSELQSKHPIATQTGLYFKLLSCKAGDGPKSPSPVLLFPPTLLKDPPLPSEKKSSAFLPKSERRVAGRSWRLKGSCKDESRNTRFLCSGIPPVSQDDTEKPLRA